MNDKFWETVLATVYKFYCQQIVPSFLTDALPSHNFHTKQLSQSQEDQQIQEIKVFASAVCSLLYSSSTAQTKIILSKIGFEKRGITPERDLDCFNFQTFLLTRILSDAT